MDVTHLDPAGSEVADVSETTAAIAEPTTETAAPEPTTEVSAEDYYGTDDSGPKPEGDDAADAEPDDDDAAEGEEPEEPEEPAIKRPTSWKDGEGDWDALPRPTQEYLSKREADRDRFVNTKAQEAAQARQTVAQEAQQALAEMHQRQAAELQRYAQQFMPQPPDDRLLGTGDPADTQQFLLQQRQFQSAQAQQQQLQQRAAQEMAQAQQLEGQQAAQHAQAEQARLREELPDYFDETEGPKLRGELQSIGQSLGYSPDLMAEAGADDILALRTAHSWKAKADKWDAYQKAKMKPVREAKRAPVATPNVRQSTPTQVLTAEDFYS